MRAIVAVCEDWGIGYSGQLLVHNPADMKAFVHHTRGGTVIMGRATLDSFPGGKPLKNRRNIVLTRDMMFSREGVEVAHSVDEVLKLVAADDPSTVWVIGGSSIYEQLLPYCDEAVVTKNACVRAADSFFPNLDAMPEWQQSELVDSGVTDEGVSWQILEYTQAHRD